jgi:rhodanese-related sulfurtransferase
VNDHPTHPGAAEGTPQLKKVLFEAALVGAIGAVLALAANAVSPRGLALGRNYFPGGTNGLVSVPMIAPSSSGAAETNMVSAEERLAAQLKDQGLELVVRAQAVQLLHDPRVQQGAIVFVDARDDERYQAGHIPGAYQLDPYHPEKYLSAVLPVCQAAEQIVFYCYGTDCEDSQLAAVTVRDAGITNAKLFVYAGGMAEWATNALPVESGILRDARP